MTQATGQPHLTRDILNPLATKTPVVRREYHRPVRTHSSLADGRAWTCTKATAACCCSGSGDPRLRLLPSHSACGAACVSAARHGGLSRPGPTNAPPDPQRPRKHMLLSNKVQLAMRSGRYGFCIKVRTACRHWYPRRCMCMRTPG